MTTKMNTESFLQMIESHTPSPDFAMTSHNDLSSKIFGMVYGHALGDALGAPSEFPVLENWNSQLLGQQKNGQKKSLKDDVS